MSERSEFIILTQRLSNSGRWTVVEDIMDLVLQIHYSCKGAVSALAALLAVGGIPPAPCSEPHRQGPVQSDVQHVKPERPVGLTPQSCDVISGGSAGIPGSSAHVWHLFGFRLIVMGM